MVVEATPHLRFDTAGGDPVEPPPGPRRHRLDHAQDGNYADVSAEARPLMGYEALVDGVTDEQGYGRHGGR